MLKKRYTIILDTNILGNYRNGNLLVSNFEYVEINKEVFMSLIKFIRDNNLSDEVEIAIPKISIEEIKQQQYNLFKLKKEKINKFVEELSCLCKFDTDIEKMDYMDYLSSKCKGFIGKYDLRVLDYPTGTCLKKLIDKVISHKKPFYKHNHDGGFKDALIWESILEYAKKNPKQEYILLTADMGFSESLTKEFQEETQNEIKILRNLTDIKMILNKKLDLRLTFERISKIYSGNLKIKIEEEFLKDFSNLINCDGNLFDIDKVFFSKDLFDLEVDDSGLYHLMIPGEISYSGNNWEFNPIKGDWGWEFKKEIESTLFEIILKEIDSNYYEIISVESIVSDLI